MCTVFFVFFPSRKLVQGHVLLQPSEMFSQTCLGPCLCVSNGVFGLQLWVWVASPRVFLQTDTCRMSQRARRPFFCSHPEVCLCVCAALSDSVFLSLSVFTLTGQSGLGKSTLMNTLFKSKVSRRSVLPASQEKIPKTVEIKSISHGMETTISSCLSAQRLISSYCVSSSFIRLHFPPLSASHCTYRLSSCSKQYSYSTLSVFSLHTSPLKPLTYEVIMATIQWSCRNPWVLVHISLNLKTHPNIVQPIKTLLSVSCSSDCSSAVFGLWQHALS